MKQFELGPAWRWKLAQIYLTEGLPNCFRRTALVLTEVWQYLRWRALSHRDEAPPNETSAALAKVDRLNTDANVVATLKIMVLAGCSVTYLDRVDLVATTEEVQHFTSVFVGSDVDQIQVSIPAVNVYDWSMLP